MNRRVDVGLKLSTGHPKISFRTFQSLKYACLGPGFHKKSNLSLNKKNEAEKTWNKYKHTEVGSILIIPKALTKVSLVFLYFSNVAHC